MTKKTNQKKKINIKLKNNESFLIEDLNLLLHIQSTYASLLRGQVNEQDKIIYTKIIKAVELSILNVYNGGISDSENEW